MTANSKTKAPIFDPVLPGNLKVEVNLSGKARLTIQGGGRGATITLTSEQREGLIELLKIVGGR